ncbi:hypothetical protein FOZ61_001249 [Perkinsus olseni]|uniref:Major facilitator superfamily (MFS) profile domain-containing protein n=1 Tax=Perkinsus olseni TaxID=32597 RepID=A0A7J6MGX8_PEROL|nr:hypothetical protein FOZ61_001249 [Perkinsus olseni]KAF4675357.1 hypothetical protein FOL46_001989 [Perkinsus olseni]
MSSTPKPVVEVKSPSTFSVFKDNFPLILKLGSGFFADAYDMFVIDIVLSILGELQDIDADGIGLDDSTKGLIASATSIGAVGGMIFFGIIGDEVGRRLAILCTGSLVVLGSIASACCMRAEAFPLAYQLFLCRLVLGFGIGGEYPLSAAMASERSSAATRGRVTAGIFSMQGLGAVVAAVLPLILLACGSPLQATWRVLLAVAVLPSAFALYLRFSLKESDSFKNAKSKRHGNTIDRASKFAKTIWKLILPLLGTSLSWMFMDITFYGTGEFKHVVANELFPGGEGVQKVMNDSWFAFVVSLVGLPGYICACIFIDKLGRWRLQVLGFVMMILFYLVMGICSQFSTNAYLNLVIFAITFFWTNFGPNTTTFIIPSEIFPIDVKSTCHGFSASMGKVGAIIGAYCFPTLQASMGLAGVMYVCAGVAALGLASTLIFLKRKLLDGAADASHDGYSTEDSDVELKPSA